jgi:opacity protein-like surface antigen
MLFVAALQQLLVNGVKSDRNRNNYGAGRLSAAYLIAYFNPTSFRIKDSDMRTLKIALLATVASAALSSATLAADLIIADPVIDNTYMAPGFDWEGPYAGLWVSGQTATVGDGWGFGASLGVNAMLDSNLLAGVEGNLGWVDGDWQAQGHGKLGFTADTLAIYGLAGVGFNGETDGYVPVGIGAEFAVADPLTIKAEYQYQWDFDDGDESAHVGKVGFNWHF